MPRSNFRNKSGEGIGDLIRRVGQALIEEAKEKIISEAEKTFAQAMNDREGWRPPHTYEGTADIDLFTGAEGEPSIAEVIDSEMELVRVGAMRYETGSEIGFNAGNVGNLLKQAPRILYYEFGTLQHQESSVSSLSLGISSFDRWNNPHAPWSALREKLNNVNWYFHAEEGKGRHGRGYMRPAIGKNMDKAPPDGITPVRMYRGTGLLAINNLATKKSEILKSVISGVKGRM